MFERLYFFDIKEIYDIDEDGDFFYLKNIFVLVVVWIVGNFIGWF